jgi:hypothetical protein
LTNTVFPDLAQYGINIVSLKPIGKGNFGEVWKARMKTAEMHDEVDVVVKIITKESKQSLTETVVEMETLR